MTRAEHLAHLLTLAVLPGWKHYAWHRAQQLDEHYPGISNELTAAMNESKQNAPAAHD